MNDYGNFAFAQGMVSSSDSVGGVLLTHARSNQTDRLSAWTGFEAIP